MHKPDTHTFHIPVMGLGYTIDTPVKVARFGISSVVSIIEDNLVEQMRKFHCGQSGENFVPIGNDDVDHRALRITEYLNLLNRIVKKQMEQMRSEPFDENREIVKYFEMLPEESALKKIYLGMKEMEEGDAKQFLQKQLREYISAGAIDVNIMTKCDRINSLKDGTPLPVEYADAMAALRGFALSEVSSSVIFSAGLNPRLYTYCESFADFYPDKEGYLKKKIVLKVSDYRSALIQGKFFAKKGLWVSEFRIESGLNCGGHAFATDGVLLGPILQEFYEKRAELTAELYKMCSDALSQKGKLPFVCEPPLKVTVQGGIGTAEENKFFFDYYQVDGTGWGSPFLLVPEATNVDDETIKKLSGAKKEDYYLSYASPLGVPLHNFRKSSSEKQRTERIEKGRPGSPCYKKFLSFDTEFTKESICTASREYQDLKIKQLKEKNLSGESHAGELQHIEAKECLCEGLSAAALIKNNIPVLHRLGAVAICPGPNLAYFSGIFTLEEMVDHIYGRKNILNSLKRPNLFINELVLYIDHLKSEFKKNMHEISEKQVRRLTEFKNNLLDGIGYYRTLIPSMKHESENHLNKFRNDLYYFEAVILDIVVPKPSVVKTML